MKFKVQSSKFKEISSNQGQMVLILILITVVGLTIALSLISRTISDIRISSQVEQSSRALSAAEAGIETVLRASSNVAPNGTLNMTGTGASASYSVQLQGGSGSPVSFPLTSVGVTQSLWLVGHNDADGTLNTGTAYPVGSALTLCWGGITGASPIPAIIATIFYMDGVNYSLATQAYDPNSGRGNGYVSVPPVETGGGYCESGYQYRVIVTPTTNFGIPNTATLLLLRLQPVYNSTALSVAPVGGGINLPVQGKIITSVGKTDTGVVRKIQVNQSYAVLPQLLDFTLFTTQ